MTDSGAALPGAALPGAVLPGGPTAGEPMPQQDIEAQFGHMLMAFEFGTPPHGGIAAGLDRTVMLLADEETIREVIPFPKNQSAQDLMMGAPSTVGPDQLKELNIRLDE